MPNKPVRSKASNSSIDPSLFSVRLPATARSHALSIPTAADRGRAPHSRPPQDQDPSESPSQLDCLSRASRGGDTMSFPDTTQCQEKISRKKESVARPVILG